MNKYFMTFGSNQLYEFKVNPIYVALVIEASSENEARKIAFNYDGIGSKFCTSYPYSEIEEFKENWNIVEYTLTQLEETRK